jgi:A/G-specific adenine glycosylase
MDQSNFFRKNLLEWYDSNPRYLPWKDDKNPYSIWLSEIILQQTRVEQGTPYYHRFLDAFPTVHDLANAEEDEVLKLWSGLGYYSRARNLHKTAKIISSDFQGVFPRDKNILLTLKGIGDYTASAIVSFAFDLPHAVVDGNVMRVISRFAGVEGKVNDSFFKKSISNLAQQYLSKEEPAAFNQAIMNFGALFCTPRNPDCKNCPFNKKCVAYSLGDVHRFPERAIKKEKKIRHLFFLHFEENNEIGIVRLPETDIWAGLFSLPCLESDEEEFAGFSKANSSIYDFQKTGFLRHILTHQLLYCHFYKVSRVVQEENIGNSHFIKEENTSFSKLDQTYSLPDFSKLFKGKVKEFGTKEIKYISKEKIEMLGLPKPILLYFQGKINILSLF